MQPRKQYCKINQFLNLRYYYLLVIFLPVLACGQHDHEKSKNTNTAWAIIENVEPQPLISQALRIDQALQFLGSSLNKEDRERLMELKKKKPGAESVREVQQILDPYCLAG